MYTKYYIFILKVKGVIFSYSGNYTKDFFFFINEISHSQLQKEKKNQKMYIFCLKQQKMPNEF